MNKLLLPVCLKYCFSIFFLTSLFFIPDAKAQKFSEKDVYVPNQLIVKLKDEVSISNKSINANKTSFNKELDELILRNKVKNIERIFNENGSTVQNAKQQGVKKKYENVLLLSFAEEAKVNVLELQKLIQSAAEVEYAEPNYIYSTDNTTAKTEKAVVKRDLFPSYNKLVYTSIQNGNFYRISFCSFPNFGNIG